MKSTAPLFNHRSTPAQGILVGFSLALLSATVTPQAGHAETVVNGVVGGVWNPAGSPYLAEGDLLVPTGDALTIEPGVQVRFRGPYRLTVNGNLQAVGTEIDSIIMTWDLPQPAHEWRGVRMIGAENTTHLEYCRIEHVRSASNYPDVRGGAIYCEQCSPTIRHCRLQNNVSSNANQNGMGGGVACYIASPLIEFCVIRNNNADSGGGVGAIEQGGEPVIRNNLITGNTAAYSGGGIYSGARSTTVIDNNIITDNRAYGWGGGGITLWNWYAMYPLSKTVRNNIVADNWTNSAGGGFYVRYDYSTLQNNTVVNNTAGLGGGLYVLNQGAGDFPPDLHNFIIWGNSAGSGTSIYPDPGTGSIAYAWYCDIEGGWAGPNINLDPEFADDLYHLTGDSPCVDGGNPAAAHNDLCFPPSQGNDRNDIGAYGGPAACGWPAQTADIDAGGPSGRGVNRTFVRLPSVAGRGQARVQFGILPTDDGRIEASLPARLEVLDVSGRRERLLYAGQLHQGTGEIMVATDVLRSGVHFVRLVTTLGSCSRPLVVVR